MLAPTQSLSRPPSEAAQRGLTRPAPNDWKYRTATGWSLLPDWASFFLRLGSGVAGVDNESARVVTAISAPTRAFAAAFCAAGVVIERSRAQIPVDPTAHFAFLQTLALGTPVTYRPGAIGSRKGRGTLAGFETIDGEDYVLIRDPRGNLNKMPSRMAGRVEPVMTEPKNSPVRAMRFTRVNLNAGLMSGLLSPDQVAAFVGDSRLECVVIGNRRLLRDELTEVPFVISTGGEDIEGRLQDAVRARAFLANGECYRSDVVSAASRALPARLAMSPPVVIFDGARSLMRWYRSYPDAHWIIILDRADRRLGEATEMIDALYATRIGNVPSLTVKSAPVGIECAVFNARRGAT